MMGCKVRGLGAETRDVSGTGSLEAAVGPKVAEGRGEARVPLGAIKLRLPH